MKRILAMVMIVSIVLSMFAIFTPKAIASENVIFQDDFESYAVGTFPSAGGWSIVWNGAGDQYQAITDSYYSSPTKSLQLMGSYGWSVVVKKDFSSSSNIIGYEAYMMASPGGGGSVAFCNIPIETWGRYYAMVALGTDGYIWACEKNNEGIHQLQPFTPYTWYKIRVVVDRTAKLYNVWIDDVLERQNIPIYYDPWEILSLQFQVGWVSIENYFDNVKVFEVSGSPPHGGLPYPPRNLQAYPVDPYTIGQSFSMHLYWDPPQSTPSLVQGYKIYRGLSSTQKTLVSTVDSSKREYLDHVGAKGIYYYDVVAMYVEGDSIHSTEAACSPMESFTGIENVVHLDSLNVGPGEWIPHVFTIQQNIKIPLFKSVVADWGYWVQNVVWIDPNKMWMGGSIQVFTITNDKFSSWPDVARFPQTWPTPWFRTGQFNSTVALRITIEGDTLKIINPCNWQSFDLNLPIMKGNTGFVSVWNTLNKELGGTLYDKSPELVLVNNPPDQAVPGSTGVRFGADTSGSVDSYVRVDISSGNQWLKCDNNWVVKYGIVGTGEKSTGLHWDKSGAFSYNKMYEDTNEAEEGLWCWPNYYLPVANVPSISWANGLASISINILCPAYLDLYDEYGNLLGYDTARNAFVDQIPQSTCFSNQSLFVVDPLGAYRVEVIGTEDGVFTLQMTWQNEMGDLTTVWNSTEAVNRGQMIDYCVFVGPSQVPIVDNTPPTTGIVFGQPSIKVAERVFLTGSTPVSLTAIDNQGGSGVSLTTYRVCNNTFSGGWLIYNGAFNLSSYTDGNYTIAYNSTDNAGDIEKTNTVQVTLFSWNCVFTDTYGRGTTLKINTAYKFFQFIAPGKDFGVKQDPKMFALCGVILIVYKDGEMQLAAAGAYGGLTFCAATAWDKQTGKRYLLIQTPIFRCHPSENLMP